MPSKLIRAVVRPLLLLIFLSAGADAGAAQQAAPVRGADYHAAYQRATALYAEGRYAEAAEALDRLAPHSPRDASLWYRLARARDREGRVGAAIDAYRTTHGIGYRYGGWIPYRVAQLYGGLSADDPAAADSAVAWLERALDAGYGDRPGIGDDEAFVTLRDDPRFAALTGRPPRALSRDEGWRFDIEYLVAEARRLHSGPDRPAHSPAFDSAAVALKDAVPDLSNDEVLAGLQRLVTRLDDGHTGIYGPDPSSPLHFQGGALPVLFYAFDDGLHVVDAADELQDLIGARVTAIGPRPAEAVLAELPTYVHHDNAMTPKWLGVHFMLRRLTFLMAAGATDSPDRVTLTVIDRRGDERRVTLEGGDHGFRRKLRPPPGQNEPPRWLRHVDRNYWLETLPEADAVYWQFNQVRDTEGGPSIEAFADSLRRALEAADPRALIVDVRHNNGGNNGLLAPLVRTMVWWEQDAPGRRIFVITGRNTFSAAQNFITRVERWTDAVFVGEPSSSRPNFSGEETNLLLPYSRVRGSISNRYWQDSNPDDVRPWIPPTVPVTLSADDYFTGRDPALEAILEILRRAPARIGAKW